MTEIRPDYQLQFHKKDNGRWILEKESIPFSTDTDELRLRIGDQIYHIYRQSAGNYGKYSDYMKSHGCACCTLTTVLGAFADLEGLRPEETISLERRIFGEKVWKKNYSKPMMRQMPVSLYGISVILSDCGVAHRYVRTFDQNTSVEEMKKHLYQKKKIIVETRRVRKEGRKIISLNDKKYAGSYHTMLLLGMTQDGQVVFTDSAYRSWSGARQRIKVTDLYDMSCYMFGATVPDDRHPYFAGRRKTGGYILLEG